MTDHPPILPGAVLGLFGGGQLGRMFIQAAARLGYRVHLFAPDDDPPAAHLAWRHTRAEYDDRKAVESFARSVAGITCEFENVPAVAVAEAARHVPVSPQPHVLELAQDRIKEKAFLKKQGLPVAPYAEVRSSADAKRAAAELGTPVVFKSARGGYDGKGQQRVDDPADAPGAWAELAVAEAVAEAWVRFTAELSVIVARNTQGEVVTYGPMHNVHRNHILDYSLFPADLPTATQKQAEQLAATVAQAIGLVGLCCVEMFLTTTGELIINELAPRPHNSGHLTIEAHRTSQFEQQVRTLCNLPLGSPHPIAPAAAMANLLGDLWRDATHPPAWCEALADPDVVLHLYGKPAARPGRKMGHLTACADTAEQALARVLTIRDAWAAAPME
ncbi:5-(carboxyamino)imidazole ribonucleotide synthase [Phycisphaerales bacterium AB-hyl4]|uniref:N5-carboxyaminoimidazole ribonucleotide synthase n=1 Tax=Natronomicrosphaera hydrolytica TaxID=3242702 RepID=A0ABV4U4X0_9BACT